MQLENEFHVDAPVDRAWTLLNDVPRIVPCMPGAELSEVVDENTWRATMKVKLGPISLQFGADVMREEVDEAGRRVVLAAKARELKGRGGAQATIESRLAPDGGGTHVSVTTDLTLQGAVAQYGRGVVGDVASQLTGRFAECLARQLTEERRVETPSATTPAEGARPVGGLALLLGAVWRSVVRFFRRR